MAQKLLHYEVLERLGEGARSTIYLVQDPTTKQIYALKHVLRNDQKDIRFIEQMEVEYEISRQFKDKVDVPQDRRFIGFDGYKKVMDALKPGDVVILTTPLAFRWVHFT